MIGVVITRVFTYSQGDTNQSNRIRIHEAIDDHSLASNILYLQACFCCQTVLCPPVDFYSHTLIRRIDYIKYQWVSELEGREDST